RRVFPLPNRAIEWHIALWISLFGIGRSNWYRIGERCSILYDFIWAWNYTLDAHIEFDWQDNFFKIKKQDRKASALYCDHNRNTFYPARALFRHTIHQSGTYNSRSRNDCLPLNIEEAII